MELPNSVQQLVTEPLHDRVSDEERLAIFMRMQRAGFTTKLFRAIASSPEGEKIACAMFAAATSAADAEVIEDSTAVEEILP